MSGTRNGFAGKTSSRGKNWRKRAWASTSANVARSSTRRTRVVRAWLGDCLELWQEAGWGWALWNLRGSYGIVDNDQGRGLRRFSGHKLDRALLELLQAH